MYRELTPQTYEYIWDIYAFGKTILELISEFVHWVGWHATSYYYELNYLHLAACRMLDGENQSNNTLGHDTGALADRRYYEEWCGLTRDDFRKKSFLKYENFGEIVRDLSKLSDSSNLEEAIPELKSANRRRIQTATSYPAPLSARVENIISHPIFERLRAVLQLGYIDLIYPTANHTRFEHSLGVFALTCEYVRALWYDQGNPLFRQWTSKKDLEALLVAALLHDVGHFPLCHDVETAVSHLQIFDHVELAISFLNSKITDKYGRTLRDLMTNDAFGWSVDFDQVCEIIRATKQEYVNKLTTDQSVTPKNVFMAKILSSDIDADKLDYLIRDSRMCSLLYGESIDTARLLRTLTIAIKSKQDAQYPDNPDKEIRTLDIAIFEKGKAAGESVGIARYLMYQSVYWHHAYRAVKVMLKESVRRVFDPLGVNPGEKQKRLPKLMRDFDKLLGLANLGKDDLPPVNWSV